MQSGTVAGLEGVGYSWDAASKTAVETSLQFWENVANIDFIPTTTASKADVYVMLGNGAMAFDALGWSDIPRYSFGEPLYTVFNKDASVWTSNGLAVGGYSFITLIHEFGHLLGLAHPHDGGSASDGNAFPNVTQPYDEFGDFNLNQGIYTTMSYNDGWKSKFPDFFQIGYGWQGTPMALDIEAIQLIYGANTSFKNTNDTYFLPKQNAAGTYWSCIWDTGGVDTISNAGSSIDSTIWLLEAGSLGLEDAGGVPSYASSVMGGYTIAKGSKIENAIGGSGHDGIVGNTLANSLSGGAGNDTITGLTGGDTIDGGEGTLDVIVLGGVRSDYSISYNAGTKTFNVLDNVADRDGSDQVKNVELFYFSEDDSTVAASEFAVVDTTAPSLVELSPADGAQNVGIGADISMVFSEDIAIGKGSIQLKTGTGQLVESFDVASSTRLTWANSKLTINPTADLGTATKYTLSIPSGAIVVLVPARSFH